MKAVWVQPQGSDLIKSVLVVCVGVGIYLPKVKEGYVCLIDSSGSLEDWNIVIAKRIITTEHSTFSSTRILGTEFRTCVWSTNVQSTTFVVDLVVTLDNILVLIWGGVQTQLSKSNAKFSKSNPELKFPFSRWGGGGVWTQLSKSNAKFSKSNPELKFPFSGWGGFEPNFQNQTQNFLSPILSWNFHFQGGVGGGFRPNFQNQARNFLSPILSWNFH